MSTSHGGMPAVPRIVSAQDRRFSAAEAVERKPSKRRPVRPRGSNLTSSQKILNLFTFDQFSALAVTYHVVQPASPALEKIMENFAELARKPAQTVKLSPDSPEWERFKA